jgi:hypothetical protein
MSIGEAASNITEAAQRSRREAAPVLEGKEDEVRSSKDAEPTAGLQR